MKGVYIYCTSIEGGINACEYQPSRGVSIQRDQWELCHSKYCKAWLGIGEYNTSGDSAHTHRGDKPADGVETV